MEVRVISNITKVYPDMIKVIVYKEPKVFVSGSGRKKREDKDMIDGVYSPCISSLNRTKTLVRDIVLCNDFELFCTFTFNPKKVDRFNLHACHFKMSSWLHNQRNRSRERGKEFKYLIIPEQHKDGAWHFHALISGYTGSLRDTKLKNTSLRTVYNITSFRSGFTTAVKIDSKEGVSNYVTKYITKSFVEKFNQRRFFCSRNLTRPERSVNSPIFRNTLPIFRRKVADNGVTEEYLLDNLKRVYPPKKPHQNYFDLVREQELEKLNTKRLKENYF